VSGAPDRKTFEGCQSPRDRLPWWRINEDGETLSSTLKAFTALASERKLAEVPNARAAADTQVAEKQRAAKAMAAAKMAGEGLARSQAHRWDTHASSRASDRRRRTRIFTASMCETATINGFAHRAFVLPWT
jgi:hypothetical protein